MDVQVVQDPDALTIGPFEAGLLRGVVNHAHHVLNSFDRFDRSTCAEECIAPSLVGGLPQGIQIPAEELCSARQISGSVLFRVVVTYYREYHQSRFQKCFAGE